MFGLESLEELLFIIIAFVFKKQSYFRKIAEAQGGQNEFEGGAKCPPLNPLKKNPASNTQT